MWNKEGWGGIVIAAMLALASPAVAQVDVESAPEPKTVVQKLDSAVARLSEKNMDICTAFKIDHNKWMTASHCITFYGPSDRYSYKVEYKESAVNVVGVHVPVSMDKNHTRQDWVILHTEEYVTSPLMFGKDPMTTTEPLKLTCEGAIQTGGSVHSMGFPSALTRHYVKGYITTTEVPFKNVQGNITGRVSADFIVDLNTFQGASGSPVVNDEGEVLGVLIEGYGPTIHGVGIQDIRSVPLCQDE